jgi:hypothetical protein
MSLSNADRIQEFTYTSGVADIALEGAILGYLPFASGVGDTNSCYYTIEHYVEDEWEIGLGTYSAGVLSRDEVYVSTTGDKVPFSSGVKSVFIDIPESKRAYYDGNDNISIKRNIDLKDCVASTSGVITIDDTQFLHNFHHPTGNTAVPVGENTFLGIDAGNFTLGSDASSVAHGSYNTGVGPGALNSLTYGYSNTAFGWHAGTALASGASNTAIGTDALSQATDAYANVAVGAAALKGLIDNDARNVGIGFQALRNIGDHATNISEDNIGLGYQAGRFITGGSTLLTYANQSIFIGTGAKAQADGSTNETVVGFGTTGHGNNTVTIGNASITSNYFNGDLNVTGSGVFPDGLHTDSHGTSVNWNTAYEERGSVIPGSGLSWDGSKLNLTASLLAASGSLTYDLLASDIAGGANIRLDGSDLSQDDVKLASGTGVNVDYTSSSIITFSSDHTAGSGLVLDGVNFAHQDTSGQSSVNNPSRTYIQDVTLDEYGHVTALSSAAETVTQYTNEMAQDTVGGILADSAEISLTYVDGNPSISGDIIAGSIDVLKLDSGVQDSLGLADSALQSGDNISELTNDSSYITASSSNTLTNKSGSNSQWTNDEGYIKSADGGNAATLDSLDSTAFLRSNTSDSFTNGTLTMAVGTELLVDGLLNIDGTINIASTTISLDGPSTDFDADGGTITFNTNDLVIKTSTGYIGINETAPRAHLDVAGSGYFYSGVHTESHSTSAEWKEAYDWGDHSTQGYLTDITNESIGDLTNVNVTGAANGKILKYNSGTWVIADDDNTTYTASSFNHNDLDGLNDGTTYQHITTTQESHFESAYSHISNNGSDHSYINQDVTSGSSPTFDGTNFSGIPGTALDDTYIKANGTQALTANWDAGGYEIRARTLESDVATGTAPLTIASTTLVNNLNSDKLDNQEGSYYLARGNHTGTQDISTITTGEWKVFYSNAAGVQELALGSSGKVLTANGTSSAPTWETPASVSGFVPYTGATTDLVLGAHDVTAANLNISNWDDAYDWGDHDGLYADLSHSHGNINNDGEIGSTANLMVKTTTGGALTTLAAGTTAQYLRGDGTWATPAGSTYTAGDGLDLSGSEFSVDTTVVRTTGNQTIGGTKTFSLPISGNITGNAGTATILANSRTFTINGHSESFNGSANVSWSLFDIGASTVGYSMFGVANPDAVRYVKVNANNSVSLITAATLLSDIGAGTGNGTVTSVDTGTGLTGGAITSAGTISLTGQALALHNLSSNGIIARTGSGTVAARTITADTGISVSNGNGVSGNPTISCTITQYTDEMAQDAVGGILSNSSEINLTYTDSPEEISATLVVGSIDVLKLDAGVQSSLGLADSAIQAADLGSAAYEDTSAFAAALGADDNYVTDAEKIVIGNTSGTNTGDQTSIVGITGTKSQFDTACTDGNFLFDGDNISSLTNDSNYITASSSNTLTNKSGSNSQWTNDEGYITAADVDGTNIAQGTRTSTTVPITSSTGSNATLTAATTSLAGVMVAADKSKLDGIDSGANNYSHPTGFSNQPASALTGASVISQITVNTNGHVTGVSSRSITAANISALSSSTSSTQNGYFGNIYLRDDSTPSHYMAITCADNITANRTLSIDPNNANRTISLSGNLTVSSTATISGTNTGDQSDISDFSGTKSEFNSACTDGTFLYVGDVSTHDAVTVTDSSEIDFTLTGQDITASLKSGSIDETKLDTSVNDSLDLADSAIQAADLGSAAYEATSAFAAASHAHGSITSAGAVTTNVTVANTDRILITDASDSSKVKGGTAFGTSTSTYLRNNGTWGTPTNTTYSEISESEITTGTSSTSRTITGRRAAFIISQASYTHPSYNGDDFSVDTGALTGAWVVSDVDINVTTDSTGHVVDANGSVNTRQLTYSDIGAAASSHAHGNITSAGAIGSTANLVVVTTTAGALTAKTAGTTSQYLRGDGSWATPTNTTYSEISESEIDTGTSSTSRTITGRRAAYIISKSAAASHSHGNITSAGAIGGTANLPIITTTGGVLTTGSFGSSANTFCEGDDSRLSDARTPTSHDNTYHSTNYAAETITLTAGTGLTGGGNLTTNRTFTVSYGTSAGTACQGNDSRLLSSAQKTDLTDSGASTAHYHTADRARANHTGTQDVSTLTAGNHKIFYSDGSGDVQELTHGSNGYVLTSNGSTSAPSWQAAAGGGGLTGMTEGAVIFGSSTGTEDEDPTVFFWDKSANELAIGHAAPDCGLHVKDGQALIGHFEAASSAVPYAYVEIEAEDTSDDPQLNFNNGSDNWTVGVDHTDTSFWMIPAGAQVFGSYSGDYVRFDSSGGQELTGSIELVASVNSTDGYITKGGTIFLHDYTADYTNGFNTFLGLDAGNPSGMTFTGSAVNASYNTGAGYNALTALTTGTSNVAIGYSACAALTTGTDQAAVGTEALANCTTSTHNTAIGTAALKDVANNDNRNTAIGFQALRNIGSHVSNDSEDNLAIGYQAGRYITGGSTELTYANQSIFFGTGAKAKADGSTNELVFGFGATGNGNNTITLGNNSITSTYLKGTVKAYTATNTTANVLRFGDRDTGYGFDFRYTGAGTGNDNALEFYTDAETSGPNSTRVFIIGQDGNIIFDNDIDIAGDLSVDGVIDLLDTTNSVGQIKINSNIVFHTYEPEGNNTNTFVGRNCGNYTMTHSTGNESRYNVAVGYNALNSLTTGYGNFGLGTSAGTAITSGYENFFAAYAAGLAAQTPIRNVGIGPYTCYANNSSYNIGICYYALRSALGSANIALGYSAGRSLVGSGGSSDGSYNIYMGYASGYNGSQDTDSSYNICIGYNTFATGNYGIAIGKSVYAGTNECVIGGSTITRTSLQGNLCIDDCAQPTSNGGAVIALPDNTNEPTMATGTAGLYADDVSGTVELFAVGDDGSQAQISPHDPVTGDWIFFGYHAKKKKWQKVNMEKLVRAIEDLTGQSFLDEWEGDKNRN